LLLNAIAIFYLCVSGFVVKWMMVRLCLDILESSIWLDEEGEVTSCLSTNSFHQTCMFNAFYMIIMWHLFNIHKWNKSFMSLNYTQLLCGAVIIFYYLIKFDDWD
jgi:hypothetical protein